MSQRVILIGGPLRGKSTYARDLAKRLGIPCYCTDTRDQDRAPDDAVTYLPEEHRGWSDASVFIAEQWLSNPGPWVIEGVATARALRKWLEANEGLPCDRVVYVDAPHPEAKTSAGQETMAKGVASVWNSIKQRLEPITVAGGRLPPDPFRGRNIND